MESSKSEPALGTDKKARSSMARAGGADARAEGVARAQTTEFGSTAFATRSSFDLEKVRASLGYAVTGFNPGRICDSSLCNPKSS